MSIVEKALARAEELKKKEIEEKERKERAAENERQWIVGLKKIVYNTLDEFNGVKGLTRNGNLLMQNGHKRAEMGCDYERWENPNYDYRVEEEGYRIHWTIYYDNGNVKMSGSDLDSFANYMAEFMK